MDKFQDILAALVSIVSIEERLALAVKEGIVVPRRGDLTFTGCLSLTAEEKEEAKNNPYVTLVRSDVVHERDGGIATGTVEWVPQLKLGLHWTKEGDELVSLLTQRKGCFPVTRRMTDQRAFYVPPCDCSWGPTSVNHEWVRASTVPVLVVTRHKGLAQYLIEEGYVKEDVRVVEHATKEDVKGAHVWGVLPPHMAALAFKVSAVEMDIPRELRGVELTAEQVHRYFGSVVTYSVATK